MIRKKFAILFAAAMVVSFAGCTRAASSSSSSASSAAPSSISAPTLTESQKEELLHPVVKDEEPLITDSTVGMVEGGGMSSITITVEGKQHSFGKSDYIYVGEETTMDEGERVCVLSDVAGYAVAVYSVDDSVAQAATQKLSSVTGTVNGAAMHSFEIVQENGAKALFAYNEDTQLPAQAIHLADGLTDGANVSVYYTGALDGEYSVVYIETAKDAKKDTAKGN